MCAEFKNLGIDKIWVKAKTKAHHTILSHLNINKIIHPEEDMVYVLRKHLIIQW